MCLTRACVAQGDEVQGKMMNQAVCVKGGNEHGT